MSDSKTYKIALGKNEEETTEETAAGGSSGKNKQGKNVKKNKRNRNMKPAGDGGKIIAPPQEDMAAQKGMPAQEILEALNALEESAAKLRESENEMPRRKQTIVPTAQGAKKARDILAALDQLEGPDSAGRTSSTVEIADVPLNRYTRSTVIPPTTFGEFDFSAEDEADMIPYLKKTDEKGKPAEEKVQPDVIDENLARRQGMALLNSSVKASDAIGMTQPTASAKQRKKPSRPPAVEPISPIGASVPGASGIYGSAGDVMSSDNTTGIYNSPVTTHSKTGGYIVAPPKSPSSTSRAPYSDNDDAFAVSPNTDSDAGSAIGGSIGSSFAGNAANSTDFDSQPKFAATMASARSAASRATAGPVAAARPAARRRAKSKNIAVIFAGGSGARMGSGLPKQFIEVAGKPIIIHTLEIFEEHPMIDAIYIACKLEYIEKLKKIVQRHLISKVKRIVPGGATGQDSIYNGLEAAYEEEGGSSIVLIHDGVRPCITPEVIEQNIRTTRKKGSAVTCTRFFETPIISHDGNLVQQLPPRENFYTAQAPQTFILEEVIGAHDIIRQQNPTYKNVIDTCTLMKSIGKEVFLVEGNRGNIKVTTPEDLYIFRAMLEYRENQQALGLSQEEITAHLKKK